MRAILCNSTHMIHEHKPREQQHSATTILRTTTITYMVMTTIIWVVPKIKVPFGYPLNIRCRYIAYNQKGSHNFGNCPYALHPRSGIAMGIITLNPKPLLAVMARQWPYSATGASVIAHVMSISMLFRV